MLKGFTHARLACGCRIAFREGGLEVIDAATGRPLGVNVTGHTNVGHQVVYDIFEDTSHVIWILGNAG